MRTNKDEGEEEMKRWTKKFKKIYIYTFHANSNSSATTFPYYKPNIGYNLFSRSRRFSIFGESSATSSDK